MILNDPSQQASSHEIFLYKSNTSNFLKERGLVDQRFFVSPVSGGSHQPDLMLTHKGKSVACELKISPLVFGVLELLYYPLSRQNPWKFAPIRLTEDEKHFSKDIATSRDVDIFKRIRKEWKEEEPIRRGVKDVIFDAIAKRIPLLERFKRDKETFKDIHGTVPPQRIESYYNARDVHYINFGTHGFFRLGEKNPLELTREVPIFRENCKIHYQISVEKRRGYNDYQFLFGLQFEMFRKSPFNIGPVHGGKSVSIIRDQVNLSCFQ